MMLSYSWTWFCSLFPQHGRGAILLAAVSPGNEIINTFTASSSAGLVQQCWLAPARSQSSLGCCMTIVAAVAANSLNLPAGRSCAPSGVTVETLTVWSCISFLHSPEQCRSRGAQCNAVYRTFCGVWTPGISLIPFSAILPCVSIYSPFVSSQKQRLQSVLGHVPREARLICLFLAFAMIS